jgi:putative addiction module component (TIGR02574 family)
MGTSDDILQRALQLPQHERAGLAHQLILSLDGVDLDEPKEEGYDEAWAAEIQRRLKSFDRGEITAQPWQEALAEIREQVRGQRQ